MPEPTTVGFPAEIVIAMNEIGDKLQRATGMPIVNIIQTDPPPKSECGFLNTKGQNSDSVKTVLAAEIYGIEFVVVCVWNPAPNDAWDFMIYTLRSGLQVWPPSIEDAIQVPMDDDLREAGSKILMEFVMRIPPEDRVKAWITKCLADREMKP